MEEYGNHHLGENSGGARGGGSFLYGGGPVLAPPSSYARTSSGGGGSNSQQLPINSFHLQSSECYEQSDGHPPSVKTEAGSSHHNHHHHHNHKFQYPSIISSRGNHHHQQDHRHHHQQQDDNNENDNSDEADAIKAKIVAHPQYSDLLEAYMDCQKVGAPPEVVARLTAVRQEFLARQRASMPGRDLSKDPELDQFMEAYYDMLVKYRDELSRPLQEAMEFMRRVESQLNMLGNGPVRIFTNGSSTSIPSPILTQ